MIGPIASFILILIPILGFLVLAASMIGIIAVYIIKLIELKPNRHLFQPIFS